jgi:hypothetical protein
MEEFIGVAVEQACERHDGEAIVSVSVDGADDGDGLTGMDVLALHQQAVAVGDCTLERAKVVDVGGGQGHGGK